ncbi:MAG: A/G-specific adenine glycosylase [Phycisphaerae bacterium]|nr:A/G-specific adenine glycosylase [Phycisphaerae bacterium]
MPRWTDARLARAVIAWFARARRDLPWRTVPRDPYAALVSEAMLQQTQVARVQEAFVAFVRAFPDLAALAAAREQDVLAAWRGLGYYRRARLLHAAARAVVARHGGHIPDDPAALRALPGLGRYSAGAIASIAFARPVPAVDGNVQRVLMRLEARAGEHGSRASLAWAWERAGALVRAAPAGRAGDLNEGLIELGATRCVPRGPDCARCPLRAPCLARARALTDRIPAPRARVRVAAVGCASVLVRDPRGRVLVERRPDEGMWGGMWQLPTLEVAGRAPTRAAVEAWIGRPVRRVGAFGHATTHRAVRFVVYAAAVDGASPPGGPLARRWVTPAALDRLPHSNAAARAFALASRS